MVRHAQFFASLACGLVLLAVCTPAMAQTSLIATGASPTSNGYLGINVDAYGSWADTTFGGGGDRFNPAGGPPLLVQPVTFSSGFFFFSGGVGGQRELLSESTNWQSTGSPTFGSDATLNRAVTSPIVASDTNGDTINDTAVSAFTVTGGATDVSVSLTQAISVVTAGASAVLRQDYVFTNNAATPLVFNLVRSFDADLVWTPGGYENDNVGTSSNGAGQGPYVYQNEVAHGAPTAVTLSSQQASSYYGSKNTVATSGVPFGFGTDTLQWDAYGIPNGWANNIANVGVGLNGDSGATPGDDGSIGLGFDVQLGAGQSHTITVYYTYGQTSPVPEPTALCLVAGLLGGLGLLRRR